MISRLLPVCLLAGSLGLAQAHAANGCMIVKNARTGETLLEQGDCTTRVTPASTFKIALAAMGYDTGFLRDEHDPVLPFKQGYVDWGGENWRQPTDPSRWLKYSVVWYSQQVAHTLGENALHRYGLEFGYGNADFSGDDGQNNGLDRSWIGSSPKISPKEQVTFLSKLVNRQLPISAHALDMTLSIVEQQKTADGWTVHGKTGLAFLRRPPAYETDEAQSWGWYVGWAENAGNTVIFARLETRNRKMPGFASNDARESLLAELHNLPG